MDDVRSALSLCTHLIYGFAGINAETLEVVPLNPTLDTGVGYSYYKLATQLKKGFPDLKVYLSIGGNADPEDDTHKYLVVVSIILFLFCYYFFLIILIDSLQGAVPSFIVIFSYKYLRSRLC